MSDSNSDSTVPVPSLVCEENLSGLEEQEVDEYQEGSDDADDDEYVLMLLEREIGFPRFDGFGESSRHLMNDQVIIQSRSLAINWILQTRTLFGFGIQTAYLSVTYFDRFQSKRVFRREESALVELVSLLCLLLAAKMEEIRVPALSEIPMARDHSGSSLLRTEIAVLRMLQWRLRSITPFCYINYFLSKFSNQSPPTNLREIISELILATINDLNLMTHRPSAIAAATTLVVVDQNLSRNAVESKINALSLNGFPSVEDVIFCYNKVKELERERIQALQITQLRGRPTNAKRKRLGLDKL